MRNHVADLLTEERSPPAPESDDAVVRAALLNAYNFNRPLCELQDTRYAEAQQFIGNELDKIIMDPNRIALLSEDPYASYSQLVSRYLESNLSVALQ